LTAVAVAAGLQYMLSAEPAIAPFLFFFPGVAVASWVAGRGPGLLAVVLSALAGNYLFVVPHSAWSLSTPALVATTLFTVSATVVALVCAAFRTVFLDLQEAFAERVKAERALRYERDLSRAITQSVAEAVFVWDEEGRVTLANPEAERMFGFHIEEIKNQVFHDVFHHHHVDGRPFPWSECPLEKIYRNGETLREHEEVFFRKDGSPLLASCSNAPLEVEGERSGVVLVVRSITEQKAAAAERERLVAALEETDRRRSQFLAVLSHELRNPLAPIRTSLHILERAAPGGEHAKRALAVIDRQVGHLTRLIDDLLDVTRVSRGKIRLQRELLDLTALIRRTVEDHRSLFVQRGIELQDDTSASSESLWVKGDGTRLSQVLGNLLQNAAKFTPRGGRTAIRVKRRDRPDVALVSVRDTGVGIAREMLPRLFEPFAQAESTLDRARGGLGLGLALVKGLVELHDGTVQVHSDGPGTGAEFTVQLPLEPKPTATASQLAPLPKPTGQRVLVIEDNVDTAESLRQVLELDEDTVEVANSGADGIDKARSFKPDVVLCDIGLPGMDGYQVARAMRADPELQAIRLVALTGYAGPEDVARAREAGFDHHLAKPHNIQRLEQILAENR
jgi:PAS domain S-box-containing protein